MKKFLLFFATLFCAMTMSAQDVFKSVDSQAGITSGGKYVILNVYGWGPSHFLGSNYMWYHNETVDANMQQGIVNTEYAGPVNVENYPTVFSFEDAGNGNYYMKNTATGKYVYGRAGIIEETAEPVASWEVLAKEVSVKGASMTAFEITTNYNNSTRYFNYGSSWVSGGPTFSSASIENQYLRIYKAEEGNTPVVPGKTFNGEVVPVTTSVSGLADLEGIQIQLVGAEGITDIGYDGDGIYVQNAKGDECYAIWHPGFGGTYTIEGDVVTLRGFDCTDDFYDPFPTNGKIYFEDYGTFDVSNPDPEWDGYLTTFSIDVAGAPAPKPFELIVKNNNIVCPNYGKVEAHEAGVAADFYLDNQNLTAVGQTATLYKDGTPMNFMMTFVAYNGVSFLGTSSQITEPGTYTLEIPEGTYVDAAGNPSLAYYGSWVIIQKDEPVVDPTTKSKYTIRLDGTDYYFTTTEVKDNSVTTYSISATPEYFYIEPSGNGFTIKSADTDKWAGYDVLNSWDFSNDEKVWFISNLEGEPTLIRKNSSKGFGVDNRFEGAGVYTDKTYQYWVIEKYTEPEATEWNGNVEFSEANSIEDLLSVEVEFEDAAEVKVSNYDLLSVVFDETGDAYAIAMANGVFNVFGDVQVKGSKATVTYETIESLSAEKKVAAKAALKAVAAPAAAAGRASVVISGKSFIVDGELVTDLLCKEYEFSKTVTGINSVVAGADSKCFDLQGRRVNAAQKGIFIQNGQKVVR